MLFCHFLIMNSLGTTTTLCVSQQHSSPKVCLLFHNYRGLSITWRIKRKRPWTFSWTQQNFVYEEKRCPEIMKSCDHFFQTFLTINFNLQKACVTSFSWGHDIFCQTYFIAFFLWRQINLSWIIDNEKEI